MALHHSITRGIGQLFYGRYRPKEVLERYKYGDEYLCHHLTALPESPGCYLAQSSYITEQWKPHQQYINREHWVDEFYTIPEEYPEAFHILCKFYRVYIQSECRLMFSVTQVWIEELNLPILKYELVTLRDELLDLLRESHDRSSKVIDSPAGPHQNIEHYMLRLATEYLLITLHELQERYGHLLEDRVITTEMLYLKYLKRPVPKRIVWYSTETHTLFELEKALRPPDVEQKVKKLRAKKVKAYTQYHSKNIPEALRNSIAILDNLLLCMFIGNISESNCSSALVDHEANLQKINEWREQIQQPGFIEHDNEAEIHLLLQYFMEAKKLLEVHQSTIDPPSEAEMLISDIENIFDSSAGTGGITEGAAPTSPVTRQSQSEPHWLLQQYIPYKEVLDKFNVTDTSFKKYIRESGIQIIKITNKNKWIHQDDFKTFMNSFKT